MTTLNILLGAWIGVFFVALGVDLYGAFKNDAVENVEAEPAMA